MENFLLGVLAAGVPLTAACVAYELRLRSWVKFTHELNENTLLLARASHGVVKLLERARIEWEWEWPSGPDKAVAKLRERVLSGQWD